MRSPWQSWRQQLRAVFLSGRHLTHFDRLRTALPDNLTCPDKVVQFLAARDDDRDGRGRVLAVLVARVQAGRADADMAIAILAQGRWRDLNLIYERWRGTFSSDLDELVSRIRVAFTQAILATDLARSHNLAASLSLSTERPLREWWGRAKKERRAVATGGADPDHHEEDDSGESSVFGFPIGMSLNARREVLLRLARQAAGGDADIVFAVDYCDEDLRDVAARLGITYAAAKKRVQRARPLIAKRYREEGLGPCP